MPTTTGTNSRNTHGREEVYAVGRGHAVPHRGACGSQACWFAFTAVLTFCAYRGLNSYGFIGLGWILHTGWDVMHHLYGNPIVPFVPTSSLGCAICDPIIAAWCFAGAPSVYRLATKRKLTTSGPRLG